MSKRVKVKKYLSNVSIRWALVFYDVLVFTAVMALALVPYMYLEPEIVNYDWLDILWHYLIGLGSLLLGRLLFHVYGQIWRYGGVGSFLRLILADTAALILYYVLQLVIPGVATFKFFVILGLFAIDLVVILTLRMMYRFLYKKLNRKTKFGSFLTKAINFLGRCDWSLDEGNFGNKIKIAILGAGRLGTSLAEELLNNPSSSYEPVCFIDADKEKLGREVYGKEVLENNGNAINRLKNEFGVQEVVFALPYRDDIDRKGLYDKYKAAGFKIKSYDYPSMQTTGRGKRSLRDFDVEELLFRKEQEVITEETINYYKDKVVLITGGGGSIGGELSRQIASMEPKQLVLLDIYENGVYDIQQELKITYNHKINLQIEICSVTNYDALERVFKTYKPNIVIMAAAHKHVPLMEHNVCEAIDNNVFGTLNTVLLSEKYKADRVHMVSTDKAVNPTNVMGATKRMCEMIVLNHAARKQHTTFSATRFGNVLGSAGSVIPLFKMQIANGGPVTVTDKRIVRYFMTIPEASQLVLHSVTIAKNGELMVLDMGQPVKIYELAVNIIKLSGFEPGKDIEIKETGLRPGEKLYEEILTKSETLKSTKNKKIFIEKDKPITDRELEEKLNKLKEAVVSRDNKIGIKALLECVPTYKEL
ncbi:MAG TPA: polysaccharide biosynthesis protein [Erysipelotrichaceae bacterium]|nr:polysaccharide biosynthesis protein [Erysipelotrichaceae bacterium]